MSDKNMARMISDKLNSRRKEWHYAPLQNPSLAIKEDGAFKKFESWSKYHEELEEFLRARGCEEIKLLREVRYGHEMFHGHSGHVMIYVSAK